MTVTFTAPVPSGPFTTGAGTPGPDASAIATALLEIRVAVLSVDAAATAATPNVELGYAEKNDANFTTSSDTPVPVSGLLLSFTAPSRPYYVTLKAAVTNDTAANYAQLSLAESTDGGSTWTPIDYGINVPPIGDYSYTLTLLRRRNPTVGTAVQYRAQLARVVGGTAKIIVDGTSGFPSYAVLSAVQV